VPTDATPVRPKSASRDDADALQRVSDGRTWNDFCDALKAAGRIVMRPETPATELDRAEGWRYLTRLLRIALDAQLEHADPDFPTFYAICDETKKMGGDNPDNRYQTARIQGANEYVIHGARGNAAYLSFGTKANRFDSDGSMVSTGELEGSELKVDANGRFEIRVSETRQSGNWLSVSADSSILLVRETFHDRRHGRPSALTISRVNGPSSPAPLTAERIDRALRSVAAFVQTTGTMFADWSASFAPRTNTLTHVDQARFQRAGGDPTMYYCHGQWALAPDEVLRIHSVVPKCAAWNLQIDNYWMESLDYRYSTIHVNDGSAQYNGDGSVTIFVTDTTGDPESDTPPGSRLGVPNLVSTTGHRRGTMLWRWVRAESHPIPDCRVIKRSSLFDEVTQ
jgi:hypothetical protein